MTDFIELITNVNSSNNNVTADQYAKERRIHVKEAQDLLDDAVRNRILQVKDVKHYSLTDLARIICAAEESLEYAVLEWIDDKLELDMLWTRKQMYDDLINNDKTEIDLAIESLQDKGLIDGEYNFTKAGRWILDGEHDWGLLTAIL